jgi:hypothetical protein
MYSKLCSYQENVECELDSSISQVVQSQAVNNMVVSM